jgi:membrane-anchored glycerophosphoryl diester phosphodiesterase (GDPDase)
MSTSQVLDRTFYIYRNHFVLLAGIGALVPAAALVLQLALIRMGFRADAPGQTPEAVLALALVYLLAWGLIYLITSALASGATVYGVSKLHLGESVTIGQAYRQVFSRFWRVLGIILLVSLMVFGAVFAAEFIAILLVFLMIGSTRIFSGGGGVGMGVGALIAVLWAFCIIVADLVFAAFLYCKFSLAVPACMLEKMPVGTALTRSWRLTKNSFWRIFLVFLLTAIINIVLGLVLSLPGQLYTSLLHKGAPLGVVLQELGGFIAGVIASPIYTIAIALIYYDQRVRKEAFDLQLMMEAVGRQPQASVATYSVPPTTG